jgi:hypothetical protein
VNQTTSGKVRASGGAVRRRSKADFVFVELLRPRRERVAEDENVGRDDATTARGAPSASGQARWNTPDTAWSRPGWPAAPRGSDTILPTGDTRVRVAASIVAARITSLQDGIQAVLMPVLFTRDPKEKSNKAENGKGIEGALGPGGLRGRVFGAAHGRPKEELPLPGAPWTDECLTDERGGPA